MSDTPCVDGCGQDAATIERLRAERDRLHRLVTEAAMETYTPDGSERFVAEFHRVLAERDRLRQECSNHLATLARVEALIGKWEDPGLVCDCGHDLGQHNSGGCYARLSYKPTIVVCSCTETDDRYEDDFAIRDLRAALAPQGHPRSAVDGPEAPGQPGRGEGAAQGDSEALDDALRRHRHEWAEYIDAWGSAKGVPEPTPQRIVTALRSPRPPFGVAEGRPDARA